MSEQYIHRDKIDEMRREMNFQLSVCDKCSIYNSGAVCPKSTINACMESHYKRK